MSGPDPQFWQDRFEHRQTPWDRGAPSPQLRAWLADGTLAAGPDAPCRVAVPGCGSGHEVVAMAAAGLDVVGLDYAPAAVTLAREALAAAGLAGPGARARVEQADVLAWQPPQPLDVVYDQTCLCALHPDLWAAYAERLHDWLRPGGRLLLLAMQAPREGGPDGFVEGPPYHVHIHAARALFPAPRWAWPKPPYARVPHPSGWHELAVVLERR